MDGGPTLKNPKSHLKNVTEKIGLGSVKGTHLYAVDWSGDGYEDLVVLPEFYGKPVFLKYSKKTKNFGPVLVSPMIEDVKASFLSFADFNKDGAIDMIVGTLNQKTELNRFPLRLYINDKKGRFSEVKNAFPPTILPTASISLVDVNLDGWLDVYLGNWFDTTGGRPKLVSDRIYLGREGGRQFADGSYLLKDELKYDGGTKSFINAKPTFGTSVCDIDRNGYPDILTASSSGHLNKVWLNYEDKANKDRILINRAKKMEVDQDKEGSFTNLGGGHSFYMLCQDYNNDGLYDIAVGELFHSYDSETRDRSSILTGQSFENPPTFIRTEYHKDDGSGSWSQGDRRAVWIDINFDSYVDLFVENSGFPPKSRLVFFEQDQTHGFNDVAKNEAIDFVNPSGLVWMDFNRDGRPDLISGQVSLRNASLDTKLYAFENHFPWEGKRILKIKLKGRRSNAAGLGATVRLKTNKKTYLKTVDYSYGPLNSQNQEGLIFGLQKGEKLVNVEVRWPFLVKPKRKRPYPLRKVYPLSDLKFKYHYELTLKEP